jgi:hypothetical protein
MEGMRKARVLPLPVLAAARISLEESKDIHIYIKRGSHLSSQNNISLLSPLSVL